MKKLPAIVFVAVFLLALPFGASAQSAKGKNIKVACYLNGNLGDLSFWDSAARGFDKAQKEMGFTGKLIEGGFDPANWEPDITELSNQDWDLIITGSWQVQDIVQKIAPQHPDKTYVIFDSTVDYTKGNLGNVYSILFKQNECSFLVGALAAMITTSKMERANPDKIIGFNGNMNIPVINDFRVGYEQGAHYIDPGVKVLVSWVGSFSDVAKTKESALALADQKADVIFNAANSTALIDIVKEKKVYAIGVDSDVASLFKSKDPDNAKYIVESALKKVDNSIYRTIKLFSEGKLPVGKAETLGVKEDGVGITRNEFYKKIVPVAFQKRMDDLINKIVKGEIKVDTVF
jgi:basic membrane protein A